MKIRAGFVSNSSSASFVLHKEYLTEEQYEKIIEYLSNTNENEDGWAWNDNVDDITGYTSMDNDHFSDFLKDLDVGMKAVDWDNMG